MSYTQVDWEWKQLSELSFDGTSPVEVYLKKFAFRVRRILRLDPDIEDKDVRMAMYRQLRNAKNPPSLNCGEERYVGPRIWLSRQVDSDINTYDKLRAALLHRYGKKKTLTEVVEQLDQLQPDWDRISLVDFFEEARKVIGRTEDSFIIRVLAYKLPRELREGMKNSPYPWRKMTFSEFCTHCFDIDGSMQRAKIADLEDQLAILVEQNRQRIELESLQGASVSLAGSDYDCRKPVRNQSCKPEDDSFSSDLVTWFEPSVSNEGGEAVGAPQEDHVKLDVSVDMESEDAADNDDLSFND
jgi:hypothetical protein